MAKAPNNFRSSKNKSAAAATTATALAPVVSVFVDDEGSAIARPLDIFQVYSEYYRAKFGADHELEQDAFVAILQSVPGDESNPDQRETVRDQRLAAVNTQVKKNDTQDLSKPVSAINDPLSQLAYKIGQAISADGDKALEIAAKGKQDYEAGVINFAYIIARDLFGQEAFDNQNNIDGKKLVTQTQERNVLAWPIAGSTVKRNPHASSGRKSDKHKFTNAATGKEETGHFIGDIADTIGHGPEIRARLADLKLLGTDKYDPGAIVYKEYINLYGADEAARDAERDRLATWRTNRISRATKAVGVLQVMARIDMELPNTQWEFSSTDAHIDVPTVSALRKPFKFSSREGKKTQTSRAYTVGQFINLQWPNKEGRIRFDEAKRLGGSVANIISQFNRGKKTDAAAQAANSEATKVNLPIPSPAQVLTFGQMFLHLCDDEVKLGNFLSHLNRSGPDGDQALVDFMDFCSKLDGVKERYAGRYNAIIQEQTKRAEEQAKAKLGIDPNTGKPVVAKVA